jgi:putative transposase
MLYICPTGRYLTGRTQAFAQTSTDAQDSSQAFIPVLGFAQVDVLRYLKGRHYVSVVALPKRGERLKAMQRGKKSMTTTYTMNSQKSGTVTFPLWIACRYQKGKAKKHGVAYLFFAVLGKCRSPVLQVAEEYRHRFGIEASYRIMNAARAVTTSTNASLRLLLVAIAFILTNMWVWLNQMEHHPDELAQRNQNADVHTQSLCVIHHRIHQTHLWNLK